jgi:hydrogenase nickel incorporation protein HypA/HybF
MSLINDLVDKMERIAREQNIRRIVKAKVWLGALSHISADHFREHFEQGTRGTVAQDAQLDVDVSDNIDDPHAQDILLISVDCQEDE